MKKVTKILSIVVVFAICFASLCTPAFAISKTPQEDWDAHKVMEELDQFVYIDEANMFALSTLPVRYSRFYPAVKKSIDMTNGEIQKLMLLGEVTVHKDDKSVSSDFMTELYGYENRIYWWGFLIV